MWNRIPQSCINTVNGILEDLKNYHEGTYNHCLRVSQLSCFLADVANCDENERLQAQFTGLMHDVGKMKIPLEILDKPTRLTNKEFEIMKEHSRLSAEILEPLESSDFFREVQVAVLHHHERVDGQGYPDGLEGMYIPYISRLVLVVDTFDAMTEDRAYRKGLPAEVAYKELEKFAGTQFDKELALLFVSAHKRLMDRRDIAPVTILPSGIGVLAAG